jgi:hypothetical protein
MTAQKTPDERADDLFAQQHGALSRSQALAAGLTRSQVQQRVVQKRWSRPERGVYVLSGFPNTWKRKLSVACLAGGEGAVASHLSAAALFSLCGPPRASHVTVRRSASGRFNEGLAHHSDLPPEDVCSADHIPCTMPARTLVDCAGILSFKALCKLVDTTFYRQLTSPAKVYRAAAAMRGKKGWKQLKAAMEVWDDAIRPGSPAEARALRWFHRSGVQIPERQYEIFDENGRLVARTDFAWPGVMKLMEYDGEEFHGPRQALTDAQREVLVGQLGWEIVRADQRDFRPLATRLLRILPGADQHKAAASAA